jgi:Na+(H+)/acetate symporter ActP
MRAVTWTQVAQYIILIIAYMIPVVWLSVKQTGVPIPQAIYGYQLQKVTEPRSSCARTRRSWKSAPRSRKRADDEFGAKLKDVPAALAADKAAAEKKVADLKAANAMRGDPGCREGTGGTAQGRAAAAKKAWTGRQGASEAGPSRWAACRRTQPSSRATRMATPRPAEAFDDFARNFLALIFCLMVGTAALPHILMRYYTTPSVKEARESVTWSLFFIFLLYFTAPALAVLVKYEVFNVLVGTPFDKLPAWMALEPGRPGLLSVVDINKDGILQLGEMKHRRRHHRAGHAGNRRPAVRGLGHGGRRRPGRGAVHRRRPAADDCQRAVARPVLQDDRPERLHLAPGGDVQGPAAGGGAGRGLRWRRRNRRTSCSWSRRRSRSRRRRSSRRWCWASSGSGPTGGARRWA